MTQRRRLTRLVTALALVATIAAACTPVKGSLGGHPRVLLVGDSVAYDLAPSLAFSFAAQGRAFDSAAVQGCSVVRGFITDFQGAELPGSQPCADGIWGTHQARIEGFRPDVVLWLDIYEVFPRKVDGGYFTPGEFAAPSGSTTGANADAKMLQLIEEKRAQLTARGAKLVIVTVPPPPASQGTTDGHHHRIPHLNTLLRQFAAANTATTALIDLAAMACPPAGQVCGSPVAGMSAAAFRPDGFHFSSAGAAWVAERVVPLV